MTLISLLHGCPLENALDQVLAKIKPPVPAQNPPSPPPADPVRPPLPTPDQLEAQVEQLLAANDPAGAIALLRSFQDQARAEGGHDDDLALGNELLAFVYARARGTAQAGQKSRPGGALFIRDCDPESDPFFCNLAPDPAPLRPFLDQFGRAGRELAIHVPGDFTELFLYDLVIVDACSRAASAPWFDQVPLYVYAGGRALILGDYVCGSDGPSAEAANRILKPIGMRFTPDADAGAPAVFVSSEHPFLAGVTTVSASGVAPLTAESGAPITPIVIRGDGRVLMAEGSYGLGRAAAWGGTGIILDQHFPAIMGNMLRELPPRPGAITAEIAEEFEARARAALAEDRLIDAIKLAAEFLSASADAPAADAHQDKAGAVLAEAYARALAQARALRPDEMADVLYIGDCDPRADPAFCGQAQSAAEFEPFFQALEASNQTMTVAVPRVFEELFLYRLVIADACASLADGPAFADLQWFAYAGGTVLVAGDNYCHRGGRNSARRADPLLRPAGMSFSEDDPTDPETMAVTAYHPWLAGVSEINVFRVTPVILLDPDNPALTVALARPDKQPLLVLRDYGRGKIAAWGSTGIMYEPTFAPVIYNILAAPAE